MSNETNALAAAQMQVSIFTFHKALCWFIIVFITHQAQFDLEDRQSRQQRDRNESRYAEEAAVIQRQMEQEDRDQYDCILY